jgi:disulfide bond formation protein DsbB
MMSITPRIAIAAALILALAVIGFVLFSQYVQDYRPCELCLRERLPWYGIIGLGAIGLIWPRAWIVSLIGTVFMISAGLAGHHAGVEQGWWPGPTACTGGLSGAKTIDQLRAMMHEAQMVRCDEISWKLFGLSMATYNFLVSLAAGIVTIFTAARFYGGKYA